MSWWTRQSIVFSFDFDGHCSDVIRSYVSAWGDETNTPHAKEIIRQVNIGSRKRDTCCCRLISKANKFKGELRRNLVDSLRVCFTRDRYRSCLLPEMSVARDNIEMLIREYCCYLKMWTRMIVCVSFERWENTRVEMNRSRVDMC